MGYKSGVANNKKLKLNFTILLFKKKKYIYIHLMRETHHNKNKKNMFYFISFKIL